MTPSKPSSRRVNVGPGAGLVVVCLALLAISLTGVARQQVLDLPGARQAPWCKPDQTPSFEFGFADLARATGVMGTPTECEHGDEHSNGDTTQKTTTGVATYFWCTNTSSFTSGDEHWMLTPAGIEHWVGGLESPRLQSVRSPDLRHLCLA